MKTSKKVICLLLTLIMVVSSLPMVAFEAEAKTNNGIITYQPQATSKAQKIVNIAKKELGNNYKKYCNWYGITDNWCAMFVSWCANKAGVLNKSIPKEASCSRMLNKIKNMGGKQVKTPKAGDLVFFTWGHVGIVESYNSSTKKITTIEGNTGNNNFKKSKVMRHTYNVNYSGIKAIIRPKY